MATFMVSDLWNDLCEKLKLPRFSLSLKEKERAEKNKSRRKKKGIAELRKNSIHLNFI